MLQRKSSMRPKWTKPPRKFPAVPLVNHIVRATMAVRLSEEVPVAVPKDEPLRSEAYRRFVASLPCFCCGIEGFSQCAHANFGKAMGAKVSDSETFPLCGPRPSVPCVLMGCHAAHDLCLDMTGLERRMLEDAYVTRMQRLAEQEGWDLKTLKRIV